MDEFFWYDYLTSKFCEKSKLFYMDTDSFIGHLKTDDIYKTLQKMLQRGQILQIMS